MGNGVYDAAAAKRREAGREIVSSRKVSAACSVRRRRRAPAPAAPFRAAAPRSARLHRRPISRTWAGCSYSNLKSGRSAKTAAKKDVGMTGVLFCCVLTIPAPSWAAHRKISAAGVKKPGKETGRQAARHRQTGKSANARFQDEMGKSCRSKGVSARPGVPQKAAFARAVQSTAPAQPGGGDV